MDDYREVREHCGYFPLDGWCLIDAAGKDLLGYLQAQTTNDVFQVPAGGGQSSAVVDRKARLIAAFSLHRMRESACCFLVQKSQSERLINHLETYLFREDVTLSASPLRLLALQGPMSARVLERWIGGAPLPDKPDAITLFEHEGNSWRVINKSLTGEEGFVIALPPAARDELMAALKDLDEEYPPVPVEAGTVEVLRIEAGLPLFGRDMDEKNILPETGLEHSSVSYTKGCYIGQEVIARIKTYGAPNFALMGISVDGENPPRFNSEIRLGTKSIGRVKSGAYSPSLGQAIALAYIQKDHRSPDVALDVTIEDAPCKITPRLLPFYRPQTRKDHSKRLLEQALALYKEEENLDRPIALLREAIAVDPRHADAYEALGVFLAKQDKLDEAIALMKRLAEIDPTEIMAHTNLSIYYMKQGRIEEAELEKGEATALQFERMVSEKASQKNQEKRAEEAKKERENKIEMFKKVLEIDPVDQIANFGLASVYTEMGRHEEAVNLLETVVREYKDYSAAYLLLGKNLEKLELRESAVETYQHGIAQAAKKGDLMPLREMQTRMNQLLHSSD